MTTSTREWEIRRKKAFGYAMGVGVVVLVALVIVLLAY